MKIEELHQYLYDILCTIDDICRQENITYSLGGGTLLGAARDHGFIPWDDDADICIWYKDYPRLRRALKKHLPEHLQLVEPKDLSPHFYDFIPRVADKRFFWHSPTDEDEFYENKQNHICVDIFMVANSADSKLGAKAYIFRQKVLYGLAMMHKFKYSKYTAKGIILPKLKKLFSMNRILSWRDRLFRKYEHRPGKYCLMTNDIPKYWNLLYEREWFEGVVYVQFEDREMPVQAGYDQKLSLQYGDYMRPPENKEEFIQHMECDG